MRNLIRKTRPIANYPEIALESRLLGAVGIWDCLDARRVLRGDDEAATLQSA
jgi:hypothetical protein